MYTLALVLLLRAESISADWLNLCQHKPESIAISHVEKYHQANGHHYWLFLADQPVTGCESEHLGVSAAQVEWIRLISDQTSGRIDKRIILQGERRSESLRVSEIIPDRPEQAFELTSMLDIARNLIADFRIRSYGNEQRAHYRLSQQGLRLECQAGNQPAGILFDVGRKTLPFNHRLKLSLGYDGDDGFQLGMADSRRYNNGDPIVFAMQAADDAMTIDIPYPKLDLSQPMHWSLICPKHEATISVSSFELILAARREVATGRGLWIWRPQAWREYPDELIALLNKYHANRVFVSIEMDEAKGEILNQDALRAFIDRSGRNGIAVWAVEGDPHGTLPRGQRQFVARAKILQQYNRDAKQRARLAGVQYDIEPYLVRGWSLAQEQWFVAYIETLKLIRQQLSVPLEIVIPFWWQFKNVNGVHLMDAVAPYIDSVNVMNYRTDVDLIKQFAQPFLEWGLEANRKVSIALEAGPIPDERRWHYRKQDTGSLWHLKTLSQPVLILLDKEKANDKADCFRLYRETVLKGDIVSFQKDPAALIDLLPHLESLWSQWPSFSGVSLHGYEEELY